MKFKLWFRAFWTLVSMFLMVSAAYAFDKPGFPRLGGYLIGSPQNYESASYEDKIAKLDIAVLNVWPSWHGYDGSGTTIQQAVQNLKARNPSLLVFLYMNINELQTGSVPEWSTEFALLNSNRWWLYPSGSAGTPVPSTWSTGFGIINTSTTSRRDAQQNRYIDWRAKYQVQTFYNTAPEIDGFFTDNFFWKPRVNGDWNLDGATDSMSTASVQSAYRQGYRAYIDDLKSLMPGKYQLANVADWGAAAAVYPEYAGQLNGGVIEALIGYTYSPETWGGWQEMMREYRKTLGALAEPKLAIFHQNGISSDYQTFRYGFASCLMDDAYYYFSANNSYAGVNWFDEFNAKLGAATSAPPTTAWQKGVYRRDFENGIALVNPKGNGSQTVLLETSYVRLVGSQAPSVNNGQAATSVTLNDRDGIILMRPQGSQASQGSQGTQAPQGTPPPKKPAAPPSVSVQ